MTTTYYSTSPERVFSDRIKKERKRESSYLHSSPIKDSEGQQKGGMSFIVWQGRDRVGRGPWEGLPASQGLTTILQIHRALCGQPLNMQCTVAAGVQTFVSQLGTGNRLSTTEAEATSGRSYTYRTQ